MDVERRCSRCGVLYTGLQVEAFFRPDRVRINGYGQIHRDMVCKGCRQEAKDQSKGKNRELVKARSTFYNHADKAIRARTVASRTEFRERFGWDVNQMAHDIRHAYGNGCPYCFVPFASMGHGLADITLDIHNPEDPPDYRVNVRWVCSTCNQEKQRTPPKLWGANLSAYHKHRNRPTWPEGSLFGDWPSTA